MGNNLTYNTVISDIKDKNIKNLYLFYGPETLLINDVILRIEKMVINPSFKSLNYIKLDGVAVTYDSIINACETLPFMDEKKLVLINDCTFLKSKKTATDNSQDDGICEKLSDYFSQMPITTILILTEGKEIDRRKKIYNSIKKNGAVIEFSPLKSAELITWIIKTAEKHNKYIGKTEAMYFSDRVTGNLEDINNEISKLCSYIGERTNICKNDIELVVPKSLENNIFELVDCICARKTGRVLQILNDLLIDSQPIPVILAMIIRQYRLLLNAKLLNQKGYSSSEIASKLGIKPFVLSNLLKISQLYSENQLQDKLNYCLETDASIKMGRIDQRIAIESLLVRFTK